MDHLKITEGSEGADFSNFSDALLNELREIREELKALRTEQLFLMKCTKWAYLFYEEKNEKFHLKTEEESEYLRNKSRIRMDDSIDLSRSKVCCWAVVNKIDWKKQNFGVFAEKQCAINRKNFVRVPDLKIVEAYVGCYPYMH